MKRTLALLFAIIMMLTAVSCDLIGESPEQAVRNALTAVKNVDEEAMDQYFEDLDLAEIYGEAFDMESDILDDDESTEAMLKNLSFEIISSEKDGDKATVKAKITNVDMEPLFKDYLKEVFSKAMTDTIFGLMTNSLDEDEMQKEMEQLFIDMLDDEDNKMATSEVTLNLKKQDKSWKIDTDEELVDAIYGGLLTILDNIIETFEGLEGLDWLEGLEGFEELEGLEGLDILEALEELENLEDLEDLDDIDDSDDFGDLVELEEPPVKIEEFPQEIKILEPDSIGTRYMEATFTNNTDYAVTEYVVTFLLKDKNEKTYLTTYDTVMPGETSVKMETFAPDSGKEEDMELLRYEIMLQDKEGKEYYVEYDVKLDKYDAIGIE